MYTVSHNVSISSRTSHRKALGFPQNPRCFSTEKLLNLTRDPVLFPNVGLVLVYVNLGLQVDSNLVTLYLNA
jgi:hypothetical protein